MTHRSSRMSGVPALVGMVAALALSACAGGPNAPAPASLGQPPAASRETAAGDRPQQRPGGRSANPAVVVAEPGDTLYGVATRHRVSMTALIAANNLSDINIKPGQQLVIPPR